MDKKGLGVANKLSDIGEREIIRKLEGLLDVGDDAAVVPQGEEYLVLTSDLLYGPTHILDEMMWDSLGRYAVTVNYSDVAAMGAKPLGFLLSFGGPDMVEADFLEFMESAGKFCKSFDSVFLGGDTNETYELILAGAAYGITDKPVYRSGARVGDAVAVTGSFGGASLGTHILVNELRDSVDKGLLDELLDFVLEPRPRVNEGYFLRDYASSMMDVSDSLAVSLYEIAGKSGVGVMIDHESIPIAEAASEISSMLDLDKFGHALYGGGDYELVFTIKEDDVPKVSSKFDITVIGSITNESKVKTPDGALIERWGYEHFTKR